MERKSQLVFSFLMLAQAAHSVEECVTHLYDVFAPARLVSGLISSNHERGFIIGNILLVVFGLWCWAVPVRLGWPSGRGFAWFWILLEIGNGIGHSFFALQRGGYFPGVITAPLLLLFASWLAVLLAGSTSSSPSSLPSSGAKPVP